MLMDYNYILAERLRGLTGVDPFLDSLWVFTAETGSYIVPLLLVLMFLYGEKSRRDSLFVFSATVLGIGAAHFLQQLYIHPRPFELYETLLADASGDSFPSQHASTLFPFSLSLIHRGWRKIGFIILLWTFLNTFSRVVVGYHFPLDILAGLVIGIGVVWALKVYEKHFNRFIEKLLTTVSNLTPT